MKARDLIGFAIGVLVGATTVWSVLSYKHSLGPFRGDQGSREMRDPSWAQPLASARLRNFYKVSDDLYRGAQPDRQGFLELERLGIKTVVNLRLGGSDRSMLEGTRITAVEIPAEAWDLDDNEVVQFLRVLSDKSKTPVFVHCSHGADRTGAMTAIYRIAVQGWAKEAAVAEMTQGGFGFHSLWDNLPKYIRALDINLTLKQAGLSDPVRLPR
jgi:protein tyrosine phosphatase (PTP) superfamily phosphohydrolase (DUF442 family)